MNPLEQRVAELEAFVQALQNVATIPYPVDAAFRDRFLGDEELAVSEKSATSENQSVNESGASSYSVLGVPTGYLEFVIDETTYYIPYYGA